MKALILLLFFPIAAICQPGSYIVEGTVNTSKPSRVYLIYNTGSVTTIDSASVIKNVFVFRGKIAEPVHANLVLDHQGVGLNRINPAVADKLDLYLEKGSIKLKVTDSVSKAAISGSKLNEDYRAFLTLLKPSLAKFNKMMAGFYSLSPEQQRAKQEDLEEQYKAIQAEQRKVLAGYIRGNPGKFISLDALKIYGGNEPDVNEVIPLFNLLSAEVRKTSSAKSYAAFINKFKITAIGAIAPDFIQDDPQGKPVKLSSFRGKYVLLDFWASWCGPCRQENPNVVSVYNQYKSKNFTVLGVSLDRPGAKNSWLKAIEDDKLAWTQVSDLNYWKNSAAVKYGINAIPQNFLLDPDGRIVAKNLRGEELRKKLAELIK